MAAGHDASINIGSGSDTMHSYCKPPSKKDDDDDECVYCICRTADTNRFMIGCDSCNEWYHGDCISITEEYAKNIKQFFCLMCRERDPTLEIQFKDKKEKPEKKKIEKPEEKLKIARRFGHEDDKNRKSTRRCGECVACYRSEDCGRCDFCKDMRKFGGPNKIRQKCRYRQCINFGLILGKKPKPVDNIHTEDTEDNEPIHAPSSPVIPQQLSPVPCEEDFEDDVDDDGDDDYQPGNKKIARTTKYKRRSYKQSKSHVKRETHRKKHASKEKNTGRDEDHPRQCYGPACVYAARSGSKYCSDECGLKLATNRIYEILPQRIQQWQRMPSVADENNRNALEKIRHEQMEAKDKLNELEKQQEALETLIQRAKKATICLEKENADEQEDTELSTYCVTCGHEIHAKTALKHMEKCFNKYESQTSFGSFYQTNLDGGNIFCDAYNSQQRTYCKRLRILCPEHSKEPKIGDDEVCGCPLVRNLFDPYGEFCRQPKKKCVKHYKWEKYRRAEIDLDKMRVLFKLDELIEQERSIRQQMSNRGGVLGLMLHQTICHEQVS